MICSTTGGTENSRKWSRTYFLTCCPRSVERINIGFAVSRLRHGANERCGTNLREPGGMGQTVGDENSGGLGEPAAVWAQRYKADGPCPRPGGVALRAALDPRPAGRGHRMKRSRAVLVVFVIIGLAVATVGLAVRLP